MTTLPRILDKAIMLDPSGDGTWIKIPFVRDANGERPVIDPALLGITTPTTPQRKVA